MQSRLHLPTPAEMTPAQRAIHDAVLRTRGNVQGPFLAWLLSPGLADPAQQLGAFCRYGTSLSLEESELLILLVAARYDCAGEQQIHEPIARKAGLADEVVAAIRARQPPPLESARLRLVAEVAGELLATSKIPDALYARAVAQLGETTLVELVGIVGYYALVAYTLNAFDMRVA
jgi:4-carboxymuconolactone decarboxylase